MIRPIEWTEEGVVLIDQNALPGMLRHITCRHYGEMIQAISDLTVRGAPAIGIAAAMGIALAVKDMLGDPTESPAAAFDRICAQFAATRPTAVNLFWAINRMKQCFEQWRREEHRETLYDRLRKEACTLLEEDIAINRRIGRNGTQLIGDNATVLTHCNAGALATGGYGTALGVIRAARDEGKCLRVFADETRPVLQGARLTAWEMMQEGIPVTIITDSMAGFVMKQGKIDLVIVGADRIAANGDTANKIGTYSLAVLARAHSIPFYVAAPLSTIDLSVAYGEGIPIEERNPEEVRTVAGIPVAPSGTPVYNPAFDVTPHHYISAIITEEGIVQEPTAEGIKALFDR